MLPNELPNENEPTPDSAPSADAQPAAPAIPQPQQNFATREDLMAVVDSVKAIAAAVQQASPPAPQAPTIPEVSDEEIMNSINEGKPSTALKSSPTTFAPPSSKNTSPHHSRERRVDGPARERRRPRRPRYALFL